MDKSMTQAWQESVDFWNRVYELPEGGEEEETEGAEADWKALAPSEKQLLAITELTECRQLLDYGCGQGWGSVIAACAGCPSVTAVDVAENGARCAALYAGQYGVADRVRSMRIPENWLESVEPGSYDGFFCSNVLDVVPTEVAESILAGAARVLRPGSKLVISLNYYMEPKADPARKISVRDSCIFIDGVLRLNSLTDGEWRRMLEKYFRVNSLTYYAWPGEQAERRRLFRLTRL